MLFLLLCVFFVQAKKILRFQNQVCVDILRSFNRFNVDVLDFKFGFDVSTSILAYYSSEVFSTFS